MFRLILFLSLFPIAIALVARWWFGIRILTSDGIHPCRCDLSSWTPEPNDKAVIHRAEESASTFGQQLRSKALAQWKEDDPKQAKARDGAKRFGLAVPPLSALVAVFAIIVGKVPPFASISILLGATALAAIVGLLSLPSELTAITRYAAKCQKRKNFPRQEDEDAVIRCASAHAWDEALPPILRWIQKKPQK